MELTTASIEARLLLQSRNYDRLFNLVESNRRKNEPERLFWAAQIAELGGSELMQTGKTEEAKRFLDAARDSFSEVARTDSSRHHAQILDGGFF